MDLSQALSTSSPTARGAIKALRQTALQHRRSGPLSPSFSLSAALWHGAQQANALPGQCSTPRPGAPAHGPTCGLLFVIHRLKKPSVRTRCLLSTQLQRLHNASTTTAGRSPGQHKIYDNPPSRSANLDSLQSFLC